MVRKNEKPHVLVRVVPAKRYPEFLISEIQKALDKLSVTHDVGVSEKFKATLEPNEVLRTMGFSTIVLSKKNPTATLSLYVVPMEVYYYSQPGGPKKQESFAFVVVRSKNVELRVVSSVLKKDDVSQDILDFAVEMGGAVEENLCPDQRKPPFGSDPVEHQVVTAVLSTVHEAIELTRLSESSRPPGTPLH